MTSYIKTTVLLLFLLCVTKLIQAEHVKSSNKLASSIKIEAVKSKGNVSESSILKPLDKKPVKVEKTTGSSTKEKEEKKPSGLKAPEVKKPIGTKTTQGKKPIGIKAPVVKKPIGTKTTQGKKPIGIKAPVVKKPIGIKAPVVKKPSATKTPEVKKPSATKTPEVKKPSGTKTPEVKKPSATKTPEVKKPSGTKTPEVKKPSATKTPEVKKPSGIKTPEVKKPSATKTPEVKKPSGTKTPVVRKPRWIKRTAAKKPIETKKTEVKKPSGTKTADFKKPSETKTPVVKKPIGTKAPEVKKPSGTKTPVVRKPKWIKKTAAKKPIGTKTPEVKKPSGTKTADVKKPSETKTLFVKKPIGTKAPEVKKPIGTKTPEVKKPSGTKTPEVKKPSGTKTPVDRKPRWLKRTAAKKPIGTKTPVVKKPIGTKTPEVKKPSGTKIPEVKTPIGIKTTQGKKPTGTKTATVKKPSWIKPIAVKKLSVTQKAPAKKPSWIKTTAVKKPSPIKTPDVKKPTGTKTVDVKKPSGTKATQEKKGNTAPKRIRRSSPEDIIDNDYNIIVVESDVSGLDITYAQVLAALAQASSLKGARADVLNKKQDKAEFISLVKGLLGKAFAWLIESSDDHKSGNPKQATEFFIKLTKLFESYSDALGVPAPVQKEIQQLLKSFTSTHSETSTKAPPPLSNTTNVLKKSYDKKKFLGTVWNRVNIAAGWLSKPREGGPIKTDPKRATEFFKELMALFDNYGKALGIPHKIQGEIKDLITRHGTNSTATSTKDPKSNNTISTYIKSTLTKPNDTKFNDTKSNATKSTATKSTNIKPALGKLNDTKSTNTKLNDTKPTVSVTQASLQANKISRAKVVAKHDRRKFLSTIWKWIKKVFKWLFDRGDENNIDNSKLATEFFNKLMKLFDQYATPLGITPKAREQVMSLLKKFESQHTNANSSAKPVVNGKKSPSTRAEHSLKPLVKKPESDGISLEKALQRYCEVSARAGDMITALKELVKQYDNDGKSGRGKRTDTDFKKFIEALWMIYKNSNSAKRSGYDVNFIKDVIQKYCAGLKRSKLALTSANSVKRVHARESVRPRVRTKPNLMRLIAEEESKKRREYDDVIGWRQWVFEPNGNQRVSKKQTGKSTPRIIKKSKIRRLKRPKNFRNRILNLYNRQETGTGARGHRGQFSKPRIIGYNENSSSFKVETGVERDVGSNDSNPRLRCNVRTQGSMSNAEGRTGSSKGHTFSEVPSNNTKTLLCSSETSEVHRPSKNVYVKQSASGKSVVSYDNPDKYIGRSNSPSKENLEIGTSGFSTLNHTSSKNRSVSVVSTDSQNADSVSRSETKFVRGKGNQKGMESSANVEGSIDAVPNRNPFIMNSRQHSLGTVVENPDRNMEGPLPVEKNEKLQTYSKFERTEDFDINFRRLDHHGRQRG